IARLMVATNANDILYRTLQGGTYAVRAVTPTTSPSMDIQVSSNFERLLFEAQGRSAAAVRGLMRSLAQSRAFTVPDAPLARIRDEFDSQTVDEAGVADEIGATWRAAGYLLDP